MLVGIRKATLANYILKKERLNLGIFVSPSSFSQKKTPITHSHNGTSPEPRSNPQPTTKNVE
jgi:hypothetical protein